MQKYASVALPVDTSQWGEFMRAELVNRLSRIEPLIERFKSKENTVRKTLDSLKKSEQFLDVFFNI